MKKSVLFYKQRFMSSIMRFFKKEKTGDEIGMEIVASLTSHINIIFDDEKEVERKRAEALGIRSFQEIVSSGLTDSYLKWRGIDATLQLSQSNNAKVVVIGGGSSGMPLILNTNSEEIKNTISPSGKKQEKN